MFYQLIWRDQAIVIGQALVHGKWLECAYSQNQIQRADQNQIFYDDNSFYKPGNVTFSN